MLKALINFIKKWPVLLAIIIPLAFFWQVYFKGLLPIPSDTIIGLYHPYRDLYVNNYPNGVPFKNSLITDPVRQIIPWKKLAIESFSNFSLPMWNPYEMAGKPLLANFQSSPFYPFNIMLFVQPFYFSWSFFVMLQLFLLSFFTFLYLKNLKLDLRAVFLGTFAWTFSGFSIAWFEWGNIIHTALWLPLILLSIDKIFGIMKHESRIMDKKTISWNLVLLFSLVSSFFAGHLQIFFYVFIVSLAYLLFRWFENDRKLRILILLTINYLLFTIATAIQWIPTFQFINLSARSLDQNYLNSEGWFIPYQHLIQFLIPDFFGNPTTLNYWGIWNYGEFIGYIGVAGLIFSLFSLFKPNKNVIFFALVSIISFIFALPNFISKIPFDLNIPFLSSAQPARLIFPISFSLAVLSALGFNNFLKDKDLPAGRQKRKILIVLAFLLSVFVFAALFGFGLISFWKISPEQLLVTKRNLVIPFMFFVFIALSICVYLFSKRKLTVIPLLIIAILIIDLFRFSNKFTPFTKKEYLYPQTKVIEFLKKDKSIYRIAVTDSRIFPPNFATFYKIQSIEGYDPLYLFSYAQLIAASERREANINYPFGFNRIITPHNVSSPIINLLNVKYVLSFEDIDPKKFNKVFDEGKTKVFENKEFIERAFFVENLVEKNGEEKMLSEILSADLSKTAIIYPNPTGRNNFTKGQAEIVRYQENQVLIETDNDGDGFLVLTDSYYPTWKAKIDGQETAIHKVDFMFRGIIIPAGKHNVEFYNTLL
ncbi:MAG: YfhO family protein [bacterium]|nr:YfhO family protein [bacterium]